jgi:hypothetical protein
MSEVTLASAHDDPTHEAPLWRQALLSRLTDGLGRRLVDADLASLAWNETAGTLTVQCSALLSELRARGVASNVFRSRLLRQ